MRLVKGKNVIPEKHTTKRPCIKPSSEYANPGDLGPKGQLSRVVPEAVIPLSISSVTREPRYCAQLASCRAGPNRVQEKH